MVKKAKSKSASRSVGARRTDHKHEYEPVIIQDGINGARGDKCHWARRCKICGRADDTGTFSKTEGLVKAKKTVKYGNGLCNISLYYSMEELRKKYPEITIMRYNCDKREFEDVKNDL